MSRYSDQIRDEYGRTVPAVSIYVYKWDAIAQVAGDLEILTDDSSAPLLNPLTSDDDGIYYFNSLDGQKLLEFHFGGKVQERDLILVGALPVPQATFGGLFINASALTIPVGMDLITTTGYLMLDKGAAVYTYDAAVNSAYVAAHPLSSFIEVGGRGFRLSTEQDITPEMFGWVGVTDPASAIQAAFNDGHKVVTLSYANYPFISKITFPAYGALISFEKAVITKGANIDLFDMSAQGCRLQGLNIQGAGATYTGRGAYISAGANSYDQRIVDCDLLDFNGYTLEFVGADAGQRFRAANSNFCCTTLDNAAIKMPAVTDTTAGNRMFTNCGTISGGRLFNLDSAANTGIVNCEMVSLTFSANTSRTRMTGCRIAIGGGTVTVDGYDNNIIGNVIAGNIQLAATSQRCVVGPNNLIAGGTVTDLSNATGSNMNYIYDAQGLSLTPVWGQVSGTAPAIGNGTITARLYRNGRQHNVMISVSLGTTSTLGDGTNDWTFALPVPYNRTAAFVSVGKATGNHAGSFVSGDAIIAQGASVITVRNPGGATGWKSTVPVAWASSEGFNIALPYEAG